MSKKAIALAVDGAFFASIAMAAGDIPTRYSGSFPSSARISAVSGTFDGKALRLKYSYDKRGEPLPVTAKYTCATASPVSSRCTGTFQTRNGIGTTTALITWNKGRPAALQISNRM